MKNHSHEKVEIVLVGNKIDQKDKREVSYEDGEKFAQMNGFTFFETSAQTGEKVEEVFKNIAKRIVAKIESKEINPDSESVPMCRSSHTACAGAKNRARQESEKAAETWLPPSSSPKTDPTTKAIKAGAARGEWDSAHNVLIQYNGYKYN